MGNFSCFFVNNLATLRWINLGVAQRNFNIWIQQWTRWRRVWVDCRFKGGRNNEATWFAWFLCGFKAFDWKSSARPSAEWESLAGSENRRNFPLRHSQAPHERKVLSFGMKNATNVDLLGSEWDAIVRGMKENRSKWEFEGDCFHRGGMCFGLWEFVAFWAA